MSINDSPAVSIQRLMVVEARVIEVRERRDITLDQNNLTNRTLNVAEENLRKCRKWISSEYARLFERRKAGESFEQIAEKLDRTKEAVGIMWRRKIMKQHPGLGRALWTREEDVMVREGLKRRSSLECIAKSLAKSFPYNRTKIAIRARLKRNHMKDSKVRNKRIIEQAESDPVGLY